ncbi:MAG TPA: FAD-dependent oxidoreductase, partial [Labilithrix sp.]|nr:FAD-dependent oxidoreductase [Labilithrix sp.]
MTHHRIIVVGAGLSGLACARTLADHGLEVLVLDKGRAPGGRASTRHEPGQRAFDHGAQFFTARGEWLVRNVAAWAREGVVARWSPRTSPAAGGRSGPRDGETWWVGTPGMGSLAQHLARGLDVRTSSTVTSLAHRPGAWTVDVAAVAHQAEALVLALPAPQCATLVGDASPLAEAIATGELDPCWAAMVATGRGDGQASPVDLL